LIAYHCAACPGRLMSGLEKTGAGRHHGSKGTRYEQTIDLHDSRSQRFYQALVAHGMALRLPVGRIMKSADDTPEELDPQALLPALQAGVHASVSIHAGDGGKTSRQLIQMLQGPYAEQLHVTLAGVLETDALDETLLPLLQQPHLYTHFRYASGYPRSA